jgi:hypothetical protein
MGGFSSSNKTGDKTENTKGNYDYWILKLDAFGNIQWQNTIGGSGYDYLHSVQETTDGEFILGGSSNSGVSGDKTESSGNFDYWIIKLNSIGDIIWQKTIGGSNIDELYKIQQTQDGGFIAIGTSYSDSTGNKNENSQGGYDFWIIKLDWLGNIEWQNTIGGSSYDFAKSGLQTSDSGYLIGGYSMSEISGDKTEESYGIEDYWVVKLNESGIIEWQKTIGGIGLDILYSVIQAGDGSYLLAGYSTSEVSGNKTEGSIGGQDYWIIKLFPENPPCSTAPTGLYADFLTSSTAKLHWSADADAIKYKVQYRKSTVTTWTNTSATSNVKNLFSLDPSTTYKFRVKTNCGAGVLSDWSNVSTFTTLPLKEGDPDFHQDKILINIYPNPNSGTFTLDLSEINTFR